MNDIMLSEYKPASELKTEYKEIRAPRFPVVDFHTHYGMKYWSGANECDIKRELDKLKSLGVTAIVNLCRVWEESLDVTLDFFSRYEKFIYTFGSVDVTRIDEPGFSEYASDTVRAGYRKGMRGVKFFKELGLKYRDKNGNLIRVDDKRLKPIWDTAAELDIPVLIHIADPVAFFKPVDGNNERFEELDRHPSWSYADLCYPRFEELMEMQENLLFSNPGTKFVIPHVGSFSERLDLVSEQLDRYGNMYVDISARISELGRQPYTVREFMLRHQERILFGTDNNPLEKNNQYYYRFLETKDEYFDYSSDMLQGRWKIYGIGLPDDALRKIYHQNALKLIPELSECL
jgi:Predicted metal-dependent hydrolase of the TIM-barrel fold